MNLRKVSYKNSIQEYPPSNTELLLEDICVSFNAELLDAEIDWLGGWPLLFRLSKPVILSNRKDGKKRSLHFQYTKFFPFHDMYEIAKVYNIHRESLKKKRLDQIKIGNIIYKKIEERCKGDYEANYIPLLFKTDLVNELHVRRYPKQVYVAIYEGDFKDNVKPFKIQDIVNYPNNGVLPEVHLIYTRHQIFYGMSVPGQDDILINYPRLPYEDANLKEALSIHRINVEKHNYPNPTRHLILPNSDQDKTVIGLIQTYVKNICLGRSL